jgi:Fe-S-cluster-containing dehydrogenase component
MYSEFSLMMKCDMCYDRTSVGKKPMCASVCPSQALYFGTQKEIETLRPRSKPMNEFNFGNQLIKTKVFMMVPNDQPSQLDVTDALDHGVVGQDIEETLFSMDLPEFLEPIGGQQV